MKTSAGDDDYQESPDARVEETKEVDVQSRNSDEADMIRMGKLQQTKVSARIITERPSLADAGSETSD